MKLLLKRERVLLDMIGQCGSVKAAAYFIQYSKDPALRDENMSANAAYSMLFRIREKYRDARVHVNTPKLIVKDKSFAL
ncbi:hypothetical protein ES703_107946 [subsurface metagenome]